LTNPGFFYKFLQGLSFSRAPVIEVWFMKKLMMALICGLVLVPVLAWGQRWIEPYTKSDGTQVEGHWETPEDARMDKYTTPGRVNPYTGQFNPYTGSVPGPPSARPTPVTPPIPQNPYYPQPNYQYPGAPPVSPTPPNQNPYYPQQDYRYRGQ
jgi:hypothetical protein